MLLQQSCGRDYISCIGVHRADHFASLSAPCCSMAQISSPSCVDFVSSSLLIQEKSSRLWLHSNNVISTCVAASAAAEDAFGRAARPVKLGPNQASPSVSLTLSLLLAICLMRSQRLLRLPGFHRAPLRAPQRRDEIPCHPGSVVVVALQNSENILPPQAVLLHSEQLLRIIALDRYMHRERRRAAKPVPCAVTPWHSVEERVPVLVV